MNKSREFKKRNSIANIKKFAFRSNQHNYNTLGKSKSIIQVKLNNNIKQLNDINNKNNIAEDKHKIKKSTKKVFFSLPSSNFSNSQSETNILEEKLKKKLISNIIKERKKLPPLIYGNSFKDKKFTLSKSKSTLTEKFNNIEKIDFNFNLSASHKNNNLIRLNSSNNDPFINDINENKITDIKIKENEVKPFEIDNISNIDTIRGKENNKSKSSCSSSHLDKTINTNIPKILINKLKELRKNNIKLNRVINNCKCKFEEMNFNLGTQLKYSKWKYQISDYDKYFIDMELFGERESKEIERRKTFYDILEDTVDAVSEKKIEKKHSPPSGKKTKIIEEQKKLINEMKRKNLHDSDRAVLKQKINKLYLDNVGARKIIEKEKRKKIKNILNQSYRDASDALKI
jgi:hypothetical protein